MRAWANVALVTVLVMMDAASEGGVSGVMGKNVPLPPLPSSSASPLSVTDVSIGVESLAAMARLPLPLAGGGALGEKRAAPFADGSDCDSEGEGQACAASKRVRVAMAVEADEAAAAAARALPQAKKSVRWADAEATTPSSRYGGWGLTSVHLVPGRGEDVSRCPSPGCAFWASTGLYDGEEEEEENENEDEDEEMVDDDDEDGEVVEAEEEHDVETFGEDAAATAGDEEEDSFLAGARACSSSSAAAGSGALYDDEAGEDEDQGEDETMEFATDEVAEPAYASFSYAPAPAPTLLRREAELPPTCRPSSATTLGLVPHFAHAGGPNAGSTHEQP